MLAGMSQDFSWAASAGKYVEAYEQALDLRRRQAFTSWLTSVVEV
jgi:glycogen synthase